MKSTQVRHNKICLDLGASQIKVIYQLSNKTTPCALTLLPNVLEVDSSQVTVYGNNSLNISENISWLKTTAKAEKVIAVDQLAEKLFHCADYQQLKINTGDWRIMAAIGKVVEMEQLEIPDEGLDLNLIILLPLGECNQDDITLFKRNLNKRLKSFYYRDKRLKINLKSLKCYPEGLGSLNLQKNCEERIVIIMLGHRNSSYLSFENLEFIEGKSIQLGFHTLIKSFCERTSGQEENHLVTTTLWKSRLNSNSLNRITKTRRTEFRQQELIKLKNSFISSQKDLWLKIKQWLLKELDYIDFEHLLFTGGTAEFLKPLIQEDAIFKDLPLSFAGTGNWEKINKEIDFKGIRQEELKDLSLRLIDCYGVFNDG